MAFGTMMRAPQEMIDAVAERAKANEAIKATGGFVITQRGAGDGASLSYYGHKNPGAATVPDIIGPVPDQEIEIVERYELKNGEWSLMLLEAAVGGSG